jgi:antitoxin (DNA-binding transcriptional repressor) of toxin-antitoxin stability system
MKTMAITEFKSYALKVIDHISKSKESLVITKRGEPLAELIPFRGKKSKPVAGKLSGALRFEKDILEPLGEDMWEACR